MPNTPHYADSAAVRLETHDLIETRFAGGHADELQSSLTSLHLDGGTPNLRNIDGVIRMYYGDEDMFPVVKLSNIPTDDRVYTPQGHIDLSSEVKKMYKAITKAIDEKLFSLSDTYNCANKYIRSGMHSGDFGGLPVVKADVLCPYYFKASSSIKGTVPYSKWIPPNGVPQRLVTIVNCKSRGSLEYDIVDRTFVYLGGNHGAQDIAVSGESSDIADEPRMESTKYVQYKYNRPIYGPGIDASGEVMISSPFPKTWTARKFGMNVGLAKLRNGHFLYWATNFQPEPGKQLSVLSLKHIPVGLFTCPKEPCIWPIYDKRREDIFEGAWVLRGDRLRQRVNDEEYPAGVLSRLRGGFFPYQERTVETHVLRVRALVRKALNSLERLGGKMFGFDERPDGIFECSIEKVASHLRLPVDVLLAFIHHHSSSNRYFQGTISFLLYKEPEGKFKITSPVPVGPWMHGAVMDTGSSLLYVRANKKYYSVNTIGEVSWLSEYRGEGITEGREMKLGRWLTMAT